MFMHFFNLYIQLTQEIHTPRYAMQDNLICYIRSIDEYSNEPITFFCLKSEKTPSRRQNHEWPQTKEDFDQNDFVSKEKPRQVKCILGYLIEMPLCQGSFS